MTLGHAGAPRRSRAGSRALLLLTLAIVVPGCASTPPLRRAVETHLQAVRTRHLDALLPTLTSGHDLWMIAPDGLLTTTRAQYVDFHRQWFATQDHGQFAPEIVQLIESPRLGHALIKLHYQATTATGAVKDSLSWLALTFALENGGWRLVFDQSTGIAAAP